MNNFSHWAISVLIAGVTTSGAAAEPAALHVTEAPGASLGAKVIVVCQRRSKNASVGRSKNASDGVAQRAPAGALCAGRIQAGLLALD